MDRQTATVAQLLGHEPLICKDNQPKEPPPRVVKFDSWGYPLAVRSGNMGHDVRGFNPDLLRAKARIERKIKSCLDYTIRNL